MRALLITAEGVQEIEHDDTLASFYRHIDCDCMDGAGYPDRHHAAWVDDNGLIMPKPGSPVHRVSWHGQPLVGNIMVTGFDPNTGETTTATMTTHYLANQVHLLGFLAAEED